MLLIINIKILTLNSKLHRSQLYLFPVVNPGKKTFLKEKK